MGFNLDRFTRCRNETRGGHLHPGFNTAPGEAEPMIGAKENHIRPPVQSPDPDAVTAEDGWIHADSLRAPGGITGSLGWHRATVDSARQMRGIGKKGFAVPVMPSGGACGMTITHTRADEIPDEEAGSIIPGAGHPLPGEVPGMPARAVAPRFDAAGTR